MPSEEQDYDFWEQLAQAKGFPQDHTHESRGYLTDPALTGTLPEQNITTLEEKNAH